mmetsp:Transcript_31169/g.74014  ORF Transcript_31169/g.74014 Transcript_31169/m.74014 type:complete len:263 (+) Transcript_31169:478-1266(+)
MSRYPRTNCASRTPRFAGLFSSIAAAAKSFLVPRPDMVMCATLMIASISSCAAAARYRSIAPSKSCAPPHPFWRQAARLYCALGMPCVAAFSNSFRASTGSLSRPQPSRAKMPSMNTAWWFPASADWVISTHASTRSFSNPIEPFMYAMPRLYAAVSFPSSACFRIAARVFSMVPPIVTFVPSSTTDAGASAPNAIARTCPAPRNALPRRAATEPSLAPDCHGDAAAVCDAAKARVLNERGVEERTAAPGRSSARLMSMFAR